MWKDVDIIKVLLIKTYCTELYDILHYQILQVSSKIELN